MLENDMNPLSVLSWNMYQAPQMWGRVKRYKALLTRLIELVDEKDPDIICLQEVHIYKLGRIGKFLYNSGFPNYRGLFCNIINFVTELVMMLENRWTNQTAQEINDDNIRKLRLFLSSRGYICSYSPIEKDSYMNNGLAIFSKQSLQKISPTFSINFHSDRILQPGILYFQIEIDDRKVWIVNTHLLAKMNPKYFLHRFVEMYRRLTHVNTFETIVDSYTTIAYLTKSILSSSIPTDILLVGDFNTDYQSKLYNVFSHMIDTPQTINLYKHFHKRLSASSLSNRSQDIEITQQDGEHIDYIYHFSNKCTREIHQFEIGKIDDRISDHAYLYSLFSI